ncbi:hypothetical protein TNCV_2457321 [Trichonephila clavipes]|nr:hypothetical protein TNCV_2457321 [Trichonephila clavipes]
MPLSRKVPSFQDLTEYEKSVVEELRKRTFHDLTPKMQEEETVFYRFCKARDYDLEKAEIMLRKAENDSFSLHVISGTIRSCRLGIR